VKALTNWCIAANLLTRVEHEAECAHDSFNLRLLDQLLLRTLLLVVRK
jgi:hypothetical protein